jgi:hypothetical protein
VVVLVVLILALVLRVFLFAVIVPIVVFVVLLFFLNLKDEGGAALGAGKTGSRIPRMETMMVRPLSWSRLKTKSTTST